MKKDTVYILIIIGISIAFILSMMLHDRTKNELKSIKQEHQTKINSIEKQRDSIAGEKALLVLKVDSLKKEAGKTPKKIETIITKYVTIIDSTLAQPVSDKERMLADRIHH